MVALCHPQTKGNQMPTPKVQYAALVYQAGIANVFALGAMSLDAVQRDARRLLQSDFRTCEAYARGLKDAGVVVTTAACNKAGEIKDAEWSINLDEQPFSEKFHPVFSGEVRP